MLRGLLFPAPRDERGTVATLFAILLASGVLMGLCAVAVDTARWYVEVQRVQKAADAAALAGVPFLPYDLPNATTRAKDVAKRNGYDDAAADVTVAVSQNPDLKSQLIVDVSSRIPNTFGGLLGVDDIIITRRAVADYKGPAPMGSPCNTFGNEPNPGGGADSPNPKGTAQDTNSVTKFPNCKRRPQLWATIEGPQTEKQQGDRYQTRSCASGTHGCTGTTNNEYNPAGYFFVVKVQPAAVNTPINLQLYDPAFVFSGPDCASMPASGFVDNMNTYVNADGIKRYGRTSATSTGTDVPPFCNGDYFPGSSGSPAAMTTSFVLREQNDAQDPMRGSPVSGCMRQYAGRNTAPTVASLRSTGSSTSNYNKHLASVFHNWTNFCTFTPNRAGDWYLQVRSNVSAAGGAAFANTNSLAAMVYNGTTAVSAATGNTTSGYGNNSFAMRAVTASGKEGAVAVSGYERMPMFANAPSATTTFNLIRVLPAAAGQYIQFSFYDVADTTGASGTVTVSLPADAKDSTTGAAISVPFPGGCVNEGGPTMNATQRANCSAPVTNAANNGKLETITIPIPSTYTCNADSLGGCWYQVTVSFPGATSVTDITTWDAIITGDPVRLVE